MKKIIFLFLAVVLIFVSCNKKSDDEFKPTEPYSKEMKVWEVKLYYGIDLVKAQEEYFAMLPASLRGKPIKADAVVVVWFNTLGFDGTTVSNLPADWKFAGVQKLAPEPLQSICNWYAGGTSTSTSLSCPAAASVAGTKRGWGTDMVDNVYVSETVTT